MATLTAAAVFPHEVAEALAVTLIKVMAFIISEVSGLSSAGLCYIVRDRSVIGRTYAF